MISVYISNWITFTTTIGLVFIAGAFMYRRNWLNRYLLLLALIRFIHSDGVFHTHWHQFFFHSSLSRFPSFNHLAVHEADSQEHLCSFVDEVGNFAHQTPQNSKHSHNKSEIFEIFNAYLCQKFTAKKWIAPIEVFEIFNVHLCQKFTGWTRSQNSDYNES